MPSLAAAPWPYAATYRSRSPPRICSGRPPWAQEEREEREESPRRLGRRQGLSPILSPTLTLGRYWDKISLDAKDFVGKLLVVDPKQRMDCRAALKHRWLVSEQAAH